MLIAPATREHPHRQGHREGRVPLARDVRGQGRQSPSLENIFLDCGCSNREEWKKLGVHVGCVMRLRDEFVVLNDRFFTGRALDNRDRRLHDR